MPFQSERPLLRLDCEDQNDAEQWVLHHTVKPHHHHSITQSHHHITPSNHHSITTNNYNSQRGVSHKNSYLVSTCLMPSMMVVVLMGKVLRTHNFYQFFPRIKSM